MNPTSVLAPPQWVISVRVDGEVLAARSSVGPLSLLLLTGPEGYKVPEIEGWLKELIGVANETRGAESGAPIPALLHRALTGLLFSHAELWERSAAHQPCSLACLGNGEVLAFGWVGDAQACVWVGDDPVSPNWVRVRDSEGREAHALSLDPARTARVVLEWGSTSEAGTVRRAEVTAEWTPPASPTLASQDAADRADRPAVDAPGASDPHAGGRQGQRPWTFRSWVNLLGFGGAAGREQTDLVPPTPEPESLTALTAPIESGAPFGSAGEAIGGGVEPDVTTAGFVEDAKPEVTAIGPAPTIPEVELKLIATLPNMAPPDWRAVATEPVGEEDATTVEDLPAAPASLDPEVTPGFPIEEPAAAQAGPGEEWAAEPRSVPPRPARPRVARGNWPEEEIRRALPWRRIASVVAVVAVLFAIGWLLGGSGTRAGHEGRFAWIGRAFDTLGFGPGHYSLMVDSQPQGALVAVDGRDAGQRTPATLELRPGTHQVTLSLPNLGSASYSVRGVKGEHVPLNGLLWGSLQIGSSDPSVPVMVTVDGVQRGAAPVGVDGLPPGIHKVEFAAPGIGAWQQTAEVHIHETAELTARPLASPPTGILQVQATVSPDGEPQSLSGARVWVDGESAGTTPLKIELARGPHSVRVMYRSEESPVQLIDLPGGNVRYATFELGAEVFQPRVVASGMPPRVPLDRPIVISSSLQGVQAGDVSEMWLHASTPEGAWRRYAMTLLRGPSGAVGVAVFPLSAFDARGRARWYTSAQVATGDEFFTEILPAQSVPR